MAVEVVEILVVGWSHGRDDEEVGLAFKGRWWLVKALKVERREGETYLALRSPVRTVACICRISRPVKLFPTNSHCWGGRRSELEWLRDIDQSTTFRR